MKKIFSFAAVLFAAMTVNAIVYDFTTITSEADYVITNADKNAESTETKMIYDVEGGKVIEMYLNAAPDVVFSITNSSAKAKIFVVNLGEGDASVEFGGKNGVITIKNVDTDADVVVTAAAKGSTAGILTATQNATGEDVDFPAKKAGADGADEQGYIWVDAKFVATNSTVELKETNGGIRIRKIVVGGEETALNDVEGVAAKAQKIVENGQIYILKNGVKYNVLGAQVAE